jgi:TRAP-type C4-dicarboxylate transport system permease small subunit
MVRERGSSKRIIGSVADGISNISHWVGKVGGYATVSLIVGLMFYEVVSRYVFNSPTKFTLETVLLLQMLFVATSAAYILKEEGHVTIGFVTDRLSDNVRNWLTCATSILCALYCAFVCLQLWKTAIWNVRVHAVTDRMDFPIAPFQFFLIAGLALLGLQFIARSYKYYKMTGRATASRKSGE